MKKIFLIALVIALCFTVTALSSCKDNDETTTGPSQETPNELAFMLNDGEESYSVIGIGTWEDKEITVPSYYNSMPVTAIGDGAFKNNTEITRIVLPIGITSIGSSAFEGCTSITDVTLPEGCVVIGDKA